MLPPDPHFFCNITWFYPACWGLCSSAYTLFIYTLIYTVEYFQSYMIFFLKTRQEKSFLFYFLPSALQGRFQQYENTAGNWDSPSVPTLLQPTRGTGKMALTCLLEYQRVVWPSHLKVLYVSILWLFHSSGERISYLKLLSQFRAHRSNRNQFLTSSSASKSRSIHFIFRYFKNFLLNALFFFFFAVLPASSSEASSATVNFCGEYSPPYN